MKKGIPLHELSQGIRDKLYASGEITDDERLGKNRKQRNQVPSKVAGNTNKQTKEADIPAYFQCPVRIRLTHYRVQEPDSDAPIVKWVVDALVAGRILEDDSRLYIKERPTETFVKVNHYEQEKTEVKIEEVS